MSPVKQKNEFERRQETDDVGSEERLGGFLSLLPNAQLIRNFVTGRENFALIYNKAKELPRW